jgi:CRP-like cAMP-binding protein
MEKKLPASGGQACLHCPAYELGICRAIVAPHDDRERQPIEQSVRSVAARRVVFRDQDLHDFVPVICDGWASRGVRVRGGRMILSFLLPGDMIGDALLDEALHDGFVEAITDVEYRAFKRSALMALVHDCAGALDIALRRWGEEKRWCNQLIVDLGRRSAEVRVTRLILRLVERLKARGLEKPNTQQFAFPLRHHHIADATGMTSVHVTKVLSELRRQNVLAVSGRTFSILDPVALNRIAAG